MADGNDAGDRAAAAAENAKVVGMRGDRVAVRQDGCGLDDWRSGRTFSPLDNVTYRGSRAAISQGAHRLPFGPC